MLLDALIPLSVCQHSIVSLQSDDDLQLIVHQEQHIDDSLDVCSGWLAEYLSLDTALILRLRRNAGFYLSEDGVSLILTGSGIGPTGLCSLLCTSATAGRKRSWLPFDEHNFTHDYCYHVELEQTLAKGEPQRLDLAFSRDQTGETYV